MREPQKKTIDGITFEVTPLGFKQGRKAFVRLSKALGPALGAAPSVDALKAGRNVSAILERLVAEVSDDDLEWFASTLGDKNTRYSTDLEAWPFLNSANRETLFQGRLTLFFKWLIFALEVNFSDFLDLLKSVKTDGAPSEKGTTSPAKS